MTPEDVGPRGEVFNLHIWRDEIPQEVARHKEIKARRLIKILDEWLKRAEIGAIVLRDESRLWIVKGFMKQIAEKVRGRVVNNDYIGVNVLIEPLDHEKLVLQVILP